MQQIAQMMAAKGSKVCNLTGLLVCMKANPYWQLATLEGVPSIPTLDAEYCSILPVSSGQTLDHMGRA